MITRISARAKRRRLDRRVGYILSGVPTNSMVARIKGRARLWKFDQRVLTLRPHLLAIGDSHVRVVSRAAALPDLRATVSLCMVPAATAQGLHNPNSRTNALEIFEKRCSKARTWQSLVFLLGEVDCGFVIWYRAEKYAISIESQVQRSLDAYASLLARQVHRGFRTLVLSVPLPTIQDGQAWSKVANARREVTARQVDRTALTLEYNSRLELACSKIGATFLDVTTPTLDPKAGVLRSEYYNRDPLNHHLHPRRHAELVAPALARVLRGKVS